MNNNLAKKDYEITSKWYSYSAKHQYILSKKKYNQFQYSIATRFAQESFEFAAKAILCHCEIEPKKNHEGFCTVRENAC